MLFKNYISGIFPAVAVIRTSVDASFKRYAVIFYRRYQIKRENRCLDQDSGCEEAFSQDICLTVE